MVAVSSWGRLSKAAHRLCLLADRRQVAAQLQRTRPGLAYGAGRSYGDACLNPDGLLWHTRGLDRYIAFDAERGRLHCEAGLLLSEVQALLLPRGWTLPVTPGTQQVTLGGAIANDVHGKNHHARGSFGDHLRRIRLVRTDGQVIDCGPELEPAWFAATVGGIGLTGVITEVELQLLPSPGPWLDSETIAFDSLDEFFALATASDAGWEHTVAWIDCLCGSGLRGLYTRANAAADQGAPAPPRRELGVPMVPPCSLINRASLRAFNSAYYQLGKRKTGRRRVHRESCLYPLDGLRDWNRIYGPAGFYQYQSVVPGAVAREATQAMQQAIARAGEGSFLAVLKTFGARAAPGMLSFPQPGVTLALDFPNRGARTLALFERLDAIVGEAGGRLYLAKDARMPRALFEAGYPRLHEFARHRDPGISSAMSRRLMGS